MSTGHRTLEEQLEVFRQQRDAFELWEAKQKAKARGELDKLSQVLEEEAQVTEPSRGTLQVFETGATRDDDSDKNDYEGYLSPLVLEFYGDYMTTHRVQSDGSLRPSDNWQQGIPKHKYMKSLFRHFVTAWKLHRGWKVKPERVGGQLVVPTLEEALCAVLFNAMGYLHELLKDNAEKREAA